MKLVYIAHPLRGDWEANIASAREYCRAAVAAGMVPMAPYITLDGVLDDEIEADRELGLQIDEAIIARCDLMWVCGPRISEGMKREIDVARRHLVPVIQYASIQYATPEVTA